MGLSDKSVVKMLKDQWLVNYCRDVIALLRFLDIETYESVGKSAVVCFLKRMLLIIYSFVVIE
jgi:condensin complex subunit 3